MNFSTFKNLIPKIKNVSLPGEDAHCKMAPPERADLIKNIKWTSINPKRAAVLMLVYPSNGDSLLTLIQRNEYKGVHSSQIAFPGGKIESFDQSPLHTALRETEEEVGVVGSDVEIVRPFSRVYIPPSNFEVSPFLGFLKEEPEFVPDPREVASVIGFNLTDLLDDENIILNRMATSYNESVDVPTFRAGNHVVWGATAMMLSELKEVLKAAAQDTSIS